MTRIRGPINPVAENWGFQIGGVREQPMFMVPHNPEYYPGYLEEDGYEKVKDLVAYEGNTESGYEIPERFLRFSDRIMKKRPDLQVRRIDRRRLLADAEAIWRLSNDGYSSNWGYVPASREVLIDMVKKLKPIMDPDAIWFVEDRGKPVGYCLGFPNINRVIKSIDGRLFPLGFLSLIRSRRSLKEYRLFGLAIHPDYHGLGLDVLLYVHLYKALHPRGIRLEANWILEDNLNMRNALEKLGLQQTKTYRVYEKSLA